MELSHGLRHLHSSFRVARLDRRRRIAAPDLGPEQRIGYGGEEAHRGLVAWRLSRPSEVSYADEGPPSFTPMHPTPDRRSDAAVAMPPVRGIERGPYLVVATPVLAALAGFEAKLESARLCDPNGAARYTLEYVVEEIRRALTRAEELEVWGTIGDIASNIDRPKSTVTEWAQKFGDEVWCWKKGGIWAVDFQKFDAWYRTHLPTLEKRKRRSRRAKDEGERAAIRGGEDRARESLQEAA